MKSRTRIVFFSVGVIATISVARGNAQIPIGGPGPLPQNQPVYSPYLNLLRQGNSPAFNYFGLVRPELNAMNSLYGLQQQSVNTQQSVNQLQTASLTTGHPAMFLNYGGYFQSMRGGGTASGNQQGGFNPQSGLSSQGGLSRQSGSNQGLPGVGGSGIGQPR